MPLEFITQSIWKLLLLFSIELIATSVVVWIAFMLSRGKPLGSKQILRFSFFIIIARIILVSVIVLAFMLFNL